MTRNRSSGHHENVASLQKRTDDFLYPLKQIVKQVPNINIDHLFDHFERHLTPEINKLFSNNDMGAGFKCVLSFLDDTYTYQHLKSDDVIHLIYSWVDKIFNLRNPQEDVLSQLKDFQEDLITLLAKITLNLNTEIRHIKSSPCDNDQEISARDQELQKVMRFQERLKTVFNSIERYVASLIKISSADSHSSVAGHSSSASLDDSLERVGVKTIADEVQFSPHRGRSSAVSSESLSGNRQGSTSSLPLLTPLKSAIKKSTSSGTLSSTPSSTSLLRLMLSFSSRSLFQSSQKSEEPLQKRGSRVSLRRLKKRA